MKRLVAASPDDLEDEVTICTFTLDKDADKVVIEYLEPDQALMFSGMLGTMATSAGVFKPTDGQKYYDALDKLIGTFFRIETVED